MSSFINKMMAKFAALKLPNYSNSGSGDFIYTGSDDDIDDDDIGEGCRTNSSGHRHCLQIQRMHQQQQLQRQRQKQRYQETDWDSVPHPSQDMYGPVEAYEYYYRRHHMGASHPSYAYLQVTRTPSDEDLDDQTSQIRQPPPFFPNPEDLKWPEPAYLRMSLPQQYKPLLAKTYKKDPRTWLWKNAAGRRARQILAGTTSTHAILASDQQRQLQCFKNLPDGTTDLGAGARKAFEDNNDCQMLVDKEDDDSFTGISLGRDSHFLQ